jgi:hypothetical protein
MVLLPELKFAPKPGYHGHIAIPDIRKRRPDAQHVFQIVNSYPFQAIAMHKSCSHKV